MKKNMFGWGTLMMTGICMLSGQMVWAGAETADDLWQYNLSVDEIGDQIYDFSEVEVTVPAEWNGKYDLRFGEDYVEFYHPASRDAYREELSEETYAGTLFTVCHSENYDFMDVVPHYELIGSSEHGVYYLDYPTDVQGYPDEGKIWAEWSSLYENLSKVSVSMIHPGEGIADEALLTESGADGADGAQQSGTGENGQTNGEYILEDSSSRYLTEEDLKGMNANQLQMAINEIYARHNRKFQTESIQKYFNTKSWYSGTVDPEKFDENTLNQYEGKNIALMIQCMKSKSAVGNDASEGSEVSASAGDTDTSAHAAAGKTASVQLYEGAYRESSYYDGNSEAKDYYSLNISHITDTSFDFVVCLMDGTTGNVKETMFAPNTARFAGDGTTAVFQGKQYTLTFTFPDDHGAYPDVTDIVVSGFSYLEGKTMVNNSVPGHEFN